MNTIFYVAGKSGGHIIPALTLAQQQAATAVCGIFSTDAQLDAQLIKPCAAITHHIPLPMSGSWKHPLFFVRFLQAFCISLNMLHKTKPSAVISTGGLVSLPVCIAARLLRIPYDLYELNVEPGAAVKVLARSARAVYVCFPQAAPHLTGTVQPAAYPVRYRAADRMTMHEARTRLQIPADARVLMIVGGSQGSRFLNAQLCTLVQNCAEAERKQLYIVHQTGAHDVERMQAAYAQAGVAAAVFAYRDDIAVWYQAADYVMTRAGSGVLHELLFFNKRALIIPLEITATSHQVRNAQAFVERDAASWAMVRQHELQENPALLYHKLKSVMAFGSS